MSVYDDKQRVHEIIGWKIGEESGFVSQGIINLSVK